jgi:hypothetical protein
MSAAVIVDVIERYDKMVAAAFGAEPNSSMSESAGLAELAAFPGSSHASHATVAANPNGHNWIAVIRIDAVWQEHDISPYRHASSSLGNKV